VRSRPETPDFVDRAPLVIRAERTMPHTPERIFEALADTPSWKRWWPSLTIAEWTSAQEGGVGATRRVRVRGLEVHERFIAWEPGRRWGFTFLETNVPFARAGVELVELDPDDDGTRVTYRMAVEPPRLLGVVLRLIRGGIRGGIEDGLAALDAHLANP
jgi:uncharacterized protein YndB with AHSA1/START domain